MSYTIKLVLAIVGVILTLGASFAQEDELTPVRSQKGYKFFDVSDSSTVFAGPKNVMIRDAITGDTMITWTVSYEIKGLCLPLHKRGVLLLATETTSTETILFVYEYSDEGDLEDVDTFTVAGKLKNGETRSELMSISRSGRYIFTSGNYILDRETGVCTYRRELGSGSIRHVSFNREETLMSYLSGLRTYGIRGGVYFWRNNGCISMDSTTQSCIRYVPTENENEVQQFIPFTSEYLVGGISYDYCSGQEHRRFPETLAGIVCDNGLRTAGYEPPPAGVDGTWSFVLTDIETGYRQLIKTGAWVDPVYSASGLPYNSWFKVSPSGQIVAMRDTAVHIFNARSVAGSKVASTRAFQGHFTERTPIPLASWAVPINSDRKATVLVDGKELKAGLFFGTAGVHHVQLRVSDRKGLVMEFDTLITLHELPSLDNALWTMRVGDLNNFDLSPSGLRVVASGFADVVIDVDGDSLIFGEKLQSELRMADRVSFVTDNTLLFSKYTSGTTTSNETVFVRWHHRLLRLEGPIWDTVVQEVHLNEVEQGTTIRFLRSVDRRYGRALQFKSTVGDYFTKTEELCFDDSGISTRNVCHGIPTSIAIDPMRDRPLSTGAKLLVKPTSPSVWYMDGKTGECQDTLSIPADPMIFVEEGRYLWSGKGIYNGRTGELIRSLKLPINVQAVPQTSLVIATSTAIAFDADSTYELDSTTFIFLHSSTGDTAGKIDFRRRLSAPVFDTLGQKMLVKNSTDSVLHILNVASLLKSVGLDTFYVNTPPPHVDPPSDDDTTQTPDTVFKDLGVPTHPNPAVDWVEFMFDSEHPEPQSLSVFNEIGSTALATRIDPATTRYRWNLLTSSGQRIAPGMYGFLLRTQDGRVLESGTFIVAPE
ncbi:MAG: hypothetical protein IPM83_05020 [Ignavibacteria bacterium]|nr:hypothetical protein [Ignavibacteria bacterium]